MYVYTCRYVCMYVRMHVCMYVCKYVCMYVCMYIYIYIHTCRPPDVAGECWYTPPLYPPICLQNPPGSPSSPSQHLPDPPSKVLSFSRSFKSERPRGCAMHTWLPWHQECAWEASKWLQDNGSVALKVSQAASKTTKPSWNACFHTRHPSKVKCSVRMHRNLTQSQVKNDHGKL